jgi:hypothetical protein
LEVLAHPRRPEHARPGGNERWSSGCERPHDFVGGFGESAAKQENDRRAGDRVGAQVEFLLCFLP